MVFAAHRKALDFVRIGKTSHIGGFAGYDRKPFADIFKGNDYLAVVGYGVAFDLGNIIIGGGALHLINVVEHSLSGAVGDGALVAGMVNAVAAGAGIPRAAVQMIDKACVVEGYLLSQGVFVYHPCDLLGPNRQCVVCKCKVIGSKLGHYKGHIIYAFKAEFACKVVYKRVESSLVKSGVVDQPLLEVGAALIPGESRNIKSRKGSEAGVPAARGVVKTNAGSGVIGIFAMLFKYVDNRLAAAYRVGRHPGFDSGGTDGCIYESHRHVYVFKKLNAC